MDERGMSGPMRGLSVAPEDRKKARFFFFWSRNAPKISGSARTRLTDGGGAGGPSLVCGYVSCCVECTHTGGPLQTYSRDEWRIAFLVLVWVQDSTQHQAEPQLRLQISIHSAWCSLWHAREQGPSSAGPSLESEREGIRASADGDRLETSSKLRRWRSVSARRCGCWVGLITITAMTEQATALLACTSHFPTKKRGLRMPLAVPKPPSIRRRPTLSDWLRRTPHRHQTACRKQWSGPCLLVPWPRRPSF